MIKYCILLGALFASLSVQSAEHLKLNDFELATKIDKDKYKNADCTDLYNYKVCKINQKNDTFELTIDKEDGFLVGITKTIDNGADNAYFKCEAYHSKVVDTFKKVYSGTMQNSSRMSSNINVKYLDYNYKIISKCLDSNKNLLSIYLNDFYTEMIKMKSKQYEEISEKAKSNVESDLNI